MNPLPTRPLLLLLKRAGLIAVGVFAVLLLIIAAYALTAWTGSGISRNPDWVEAENGVEIYLETNGIHTSLVMPLQHAAKDWDAHFPAANLSHPQADYTHISISWGEREVFLNTPHWQDLRPAMLTDIALFRGRALFHTVHLVRPAPSNTLRPVRLSETEYAKLVRFIEKFVPQNTAQSPFPGYGAQDAFYEARGTYTPLVTCNQWTSDALAAAGVRTGWWTPLAGGVMKWVTPPDKRQSPIP